MHRPGKCAGCACEMLDARLLTRGLHAARQLCGTVLHVCREGGHPKAIGRPLLLPKSVQSSPHCPNDRRNSAMGSFRESRHWRGPGDSCTLL